MSRIFAGVLDKLEGVFSYMQVNRSIDGKLHYTHMRRSIELLSNRIVASRVVGAEKTCANQVKESGTLRMLGSEVAESAGEMRQYPREGIGTGAVVKAIRYCDQHDFARVPETEKLDNEKVRYKGYIHEFYGEPYRTSAKGE